MHFLDAPSRALHLNLPLPLPLRYLYLYILPLPSPLPLPLPLRLPLPCPGGSRVGCRARPTSTRRFSEFAANTLFAPFTLSMILPLLLRTTTVTLVLLLLLIRRASVQGVLDHNFDIIIDVMLTITF